MGYIEWIIIALIVFFFINRMLPTKGVRNITTAQLKNELNDKHKQFVDVRTPGEYKGNHIGEFKNIPLHQLGQQISQLSKDREVVVICQSGMRSNKACKILKKQGFKQVSNVKGGMNAWF
ncbi:rhodanese-like domain-containing protein [Virgibacillus sp. 179-BFC.A HS]|uniref:Rhodanese-like domain-containing protein n=2 Tax=Tigheibacillus jepli TaxID=3035914 RepID=A0ABU5CDG5_9BACI|nr:rhodanese-like domain-containing protein [Virgibacillus sp. 179-BFC.A HS]MDY0404255.1 rhodanese-like domain-containing protein [Virgibacillus sp. 179-BFC.A HS]